MPATGNHRLERAHPDDLEVLAHVIAESFFDLAVSQWLIPDPHPRRAILPGYFGMYVEQARLAALTGPHLARFEALDAAFDRNHPIGVTHEHLMILAVRPDRQRLGI
jgi:hypothetical protein